MGGYTNIQFPCIKKNSSVSRFYTINNNNKNCTVDITEASRHPTFDDYYKGFKWDVQSSRVGEVSFKENVEQNQIENCQDLIPKFHPGKFG